MGNFVGREEEITQLKEVLTRGTASGAVAVIAGVRGMGGIGKSELALKVAHDLREVFSDGQLLVELQKVVPNGQSLNNLGLTTIPVTPEEALKTLIRAFDGEGKLPDDQNQLRGCYNSLLSGKRVLVLADDAKDAAQVQPLMPPVGCALLVMSRNRFNLLGMLPEAVIDLGLMPPSEAKALLLEICPSSPVSRFAG